MDFTSSLGEFEGNGVFVEVSVELFHGEGIDILACSVLDIPRDEGFLEYNVEFVDHNLQVGCAQVGELHVPAFSKGTGSSIGQLVEEDHGDLLFVIEVLV